MPSVRCSEQQRLNLSTEELQKGVQGPNPGAFMRRGRKYFNTDACNIKGAKAVCMAIIRVLDERMGGDASEGAYTRETSLTCVHVHACTRVQLEDLCCLSSRTKSADVYGRTRNHLLWHRFPRV